MVDLNQTGNGGVVAPELGKDLTHQDNRSAAQEDNPLLSSTIGLRTKNQEALISLQYSCPILNLPAGERTETPVYYLPDVPRVEYVDPKMVARYLEQDRAELISVASLATTKTGREVAPEEALKMITDRMVELLNSASSAVKNQHESRVPKLLNYISRGYEVDPDSWSYRVAEKFGYVKLATAESYLAPDSSVSIMDITHFKVGDKIFAIKGGSRRSELSTEIGNVTEMLNHFVLNPHLQTPESIEVIHESLAGIAKKLGVSEGLLSVAHASFENGRYQLGAMGMISLARGGRDFIISFRNSSGEFEDVRLNIPQIQNAQRGVFPKWDPENPPNDAQQRLYPTSALKFWLDHLEIR